MQTVTPTERLATAATVERSAPRGSMPPLHQRHEAETYRVIDGEVTFYVADEVVTAGPGDVVVAAPYAPRTFLVHSESARWTVVTRVNSLERFLDFCRAISAPAESPGDGWPSPEEHASVASMGAANGIRLLGPPGALPDGLQHVY
jgi:hypothetical protein